MYGLLVWESGVPLHFVAVAEEISGWIDAVSDVWQGKTGNVSSVRKEGWQRKILYSGDGQGPLAQRPFESARLCFE